MLLKKGRNTLKQPVQKQFNEPESSTGSSHFMSSENRQSEEKHIDDAFGSGSVIGSGSGSNSGSGRSATTEQQNPRNPFNQVA